MTVTIALTAADYVAGGSTALLDAIGRSIHRISHAQKQLPTEKRAETVMFVIITDGFENSSREYSAEIIEHMIELQKERYGWEFIFLGANIDAIATAASFGIAADRAQNYRADSQGIDLNFAVLSDTIAEYRTSAAMPAAWSEEIQEDFEERKGAVTEDDA